MKIYLDNAATTRVDPRVKKEIDTFLDKNYANPSSVHVMGFEAKKALDGAREKIAKAIGAKSKELIFTGSGTEANNFCLKGLFFQHYPEKDHIVTTEIEHDCVLNACKWLESKGAKVTYLKVDQEGFIDLKELEDAITDKTVVVSIIHGNNEIGTIQDLKKISDVCKKKNVLFHSDACQSFTKVPINVVEDGIGLMTINAHKIHGQKGVGGLYIKEGIKINPLLHGGGQEFGLRSSTENIPGIVGFAKAVEIASAKDIKQMEKLRDYFINKITKVQNVRLNGPKKENRLCNNINLSFFMLEGELVRDKLSKKGICVSTGSACSSSSTDVSHVMKAINCPMEYLHGNLRLSLSKWTTKEELDKAFNEIKKIVEENSMNLVQ
ncbi:cysteine desulfurase [Candidatus Woesearchaeota archaeon]|nr:cysteine desulfurase [Candidatus Woesearchaeota archaeon]